MLFVAACQKDDEITTFSKQQEEAKMTTISFEEFKQNVNTYNELDRVARHKLEKIRVNDPNGFYYDTKDIVLITYKDLKTYTIPVYGGRERQKTFRNLVIQDKAGRNPHSFLLHYTLTNDDLIKLAENKPIPNLPEKTVLTAPDGGDEEYIFRASDGNCYYYAASFTPNPANSVQIFIEGLVVITAERVECPPDLGFTENDNGGGGDGGDGGDNGGGGIDNGMPINIYIPYPATPDTGPITNPAWPIGGGSPNIPDTPIITVPTTNLLFQRFKNQLDGVSYLWLLDEADQEIRDIIEDLLGNTGGDEYLEREEVANKLVEFMQDEDKIDVAHRILNYLDTNSENDDIEVAKIVLDELENGSPTNILNFIKKPCQRAIINDILATSAPFTNIIQQTFNTSDNANLEFHSGNLPAGIAYTNPDLFGSAENYSIIIAFEDTYLDGATDLAIVATALHEMVHAYLTELYLKGDLIAQNPDYETLLNAFLNYYSESNQVTFDELDDEIHNAMADFIGKMANALYNYALSKDIPDVDADYCTALAWGTMEPYQIYQDVLTPQQQTNYSNITYNEQNNSGSKKGTKCP